MELCGPEQAIYKELTLIPFEEQRGEIHYRGEVGPHVSIFVSQNKNGKITGCAMRTTDPKAMEQVTKLIEQDDGTSFKQI